MSATNRFVSEYRILARDQTMRGTRSAIRNMQALDRQNLAMSKRARGMTNEFAAFTRQFVGFYAAIAGGTNLIHTLNSLDSISNRLRALTGLESEVVALRGSLMELAQDTRQSFHGVATFYSRLAFAMRDTSVSSDELLDVTRTLNKLMTASGTTAVEAQAAMIQFSQALASGRLAGEEYRSISEQTPIVLDAIARHLGVTRREIQALAKAQKLTTPIILAALREYREEADRLFGKTHVTMAQGWTRVKNAMVDYIDTMNSSVDGSKNMGLALAGIANNMEWIATAILGTAGTAAAMGLMAVRGKAVAGALGLIKRAWIPFLVIEAAAGAWYMYAKSVKAMSDSADVAARKQRHLLAETLVPSVAAVEKYKRQVAGLKEELERLTPAMKGYEDAVAAHFAAGRGAGSINHPRMKNFMEAGDVQQIGGSYQQVQLHIANLRHELSLSKYALADLEKKLEGQRIKEYLDGIGEGAKAAARGLGDLENEAYASINEWWYAKNKKTIADAQKRRDEEAAAEAEAARRRADALEIALQKEAYWKDYYLNLDFERQWAAIEREEEMEIAADERKMERHRELAASIMDLELQADAWAVEQAELKESRENFAHEMRLRRIDELDSAEAQSARWQVELESRKKKAVGAALQGMYVLKENFAHKSEKLARAVQLIEGALMLKKAVANAHLAFTEGLANPPGPPWSYAQAFLALASGLAAAAQIGSALGGGGGVGGAGGVSGGTTAGSGTGIGVPDAEEAGPQRNITIAVKPGHYDQQSIVSLIQEINQALGGNDDTKVVVRGVA